MEIETNRACHALRLNPDFAFAFLHLAEELNNHSVYRREAAGQRVGKTRNPLRAANPYALIPPACSGLPALPFWVVSNFRRDAGSALKSHDVPAGILPADSITFSHSTPKQANGEVGHPIYVNAR